MGQHLYTNKQNNSTSANRSVKKVLSFSNNYAYDLSIVIPVYNSAKTLEKLYSLIQVSLKDYKIQTIFINDCSYDNSWQEIEKIQKENTTNVIAINLDKNAGQHIALFCGMQMVQAKYIVTLDDDLQIHPKEIINLLETIIKENADLVYGIFSSKKHYKVRNIGSIFFGKLFSKYASTPRNGSSFKIIKREIVNNIAEHNHHNIYIDELLGWYSKKTSFVEIEHNKRQEGNSGYSFIKLVKLALGLFINYTALPLKIITILGILSSLISFVLGLYFLYQKYVEDVPLGFTSLIVTIFFSTGLILFSLGIIGEYLSRIYLVQSGKPSYKIKEILK